MCILKCVFLFLKGHPLVARTLKNLGNVFKKEEKLEEAFQTYQQSLDIYEQVMGQHSSGKVLDVSLSLSLSFSLVSFSFSFSLSLSFPFVWACIWATVLSKYTRWGRGIGVSKEREREREKRNCCFYDTHIYTQCLSIFLVGVQIKHQYMCR
jgi:hypothetical protein